MKVALMWWGSGIVSNHVGSYPIMQYDTGYDKLQLRLLSIIFLKKISKITTADKGFSI